MEALLKALDVYRRYDPQGWVDVYRLLPTWGGVGAALLGLTLMLVGGGRLFRVVAGPMGAAVGLLWVPAVVSRLGFPEHAAASGTLSALALLVVGVVLPPGVLFFAFGIPAGLLGAEVAGTADWALGFFPGLLLGGALGAVLARFVGAVAASMVGAWLLVLGLLAALQTTGGSVEALAKQPIGLLIAAGLLAVAGIVFQLWVRPSPQAAQQEKFDRGLDEKRAAEKRAVEKRWANYSKEKDKAKAKAKARD
jgi:hypothetical protein